MRVINNKNIKTELLLDLYFPYMLNTIKSNQIESIRFETDCIHLMGLDDNIVDEMEYFDVSTNIPTIFEWRD